MIRKTDIKRLWDALLILKHEEDIDDVRKVETHNPTDWREKQEQQVEDVSSGKIKFENPGSAAEVSSVRSSGGTSPFTSPEQAAAQTAYKHEMQRANDPLLQWLESNKSPVTTEEKHAKQIANDPYVQGVRAKYGNSGRPAPKVDSQLPLELSSVKKSNESKVLRIFKKYGF